MSIWKPASDSTRREAFERAALNSTTGGGANLIQSFINRTIEDLTLRELGVGMMMDHRAGQGNAAIVNRRTASTGGQWVADSTAPGSITVDDSTYAQVTFSFKTGVTKGQVSRKLIAMGRTYGDVLATELAAKAEDFTNFLETAYLTGDTGVSADQIDGLITQLSGVAAQCVANTSAVGGDAISLAKLDEAIDLVKGSGNRSDCFIVGSFLGLRSLNAAMQSQQQFNDVVDIAAGLRVRSYDGIPIITSTSMPNDMTFTPATGVISAMSGSATPTTALMVINKRHVWIEELTPMTVLPLAQSTSQYDEFDIYWDGVMVLGNTKGAALLSGILGA